MRYGPALIGCAVCLVAQEIAPICAPRSPGLSFNCWRDKAKASPQTDSVSVGVRASRDAAAEKYGTLVHLDGSGEKDPFPTGRSDLVAVVTFSDFGVRLTPSGRSAYTEMSFKVSDVVRQSRVGIKNGDVITSILPGGAVQVAGGKTVRYFPDGGDDLPLHPGGRFLVFLRYRPQTDTFDFVKHWGLSGGRLVITDLVEMEKAAQGQSSIRPGTREVDVVEEIRQGRL